MVVRDSNKITFPVGSRKIDKLKGRLKSIQSIKDTERPIKICGKSIRESFKNVLNGVCVETLTVADDTRDDLHSTRLNLLDLDQLSSSEKLLSSERDMNNIHEIIGDDDSEDEDEIMLYNNGSHSPPEINRHPTHHYALSIWQETSNGTFSESKYASTENLILAASVPSRSAFRDVSVSSKAKHSIETIKPVSTMPHGKGDKVPENMKTKSERSLEKGRRLRGLGLSKKSFFTSKFSS